MRVRSQKRTHAHPRAHLHKRTPPTHNVQVRSEHTHEQKHVTAVRRTRTHTQASKQTYVRMYARTTHTHMHTPTHTHTPHAHTLTQDQCLTVVGDPEQLDLATKAEFQDCTGDNPQLWQQVIAPGRIVQWKNLASQSCLTRMLCQDSCLREK